MKLQTVFAVISSYAFDIFTYFVKFPIQQRKFIHDRNVEHRNKVRFLQCACMADPDRADSFRSELAKFITCQNMGVKE